MTPGDFYNAVYSTALGLGANDVQARLAAAQASEETGFGKSMVGNNAFGIKAGSTYTGPSVTASTEEEYNGNTVRENANFRAYDNFTESVKDYLSTMQENFPDSWNATSFPDAVAGLKTGVYGAYATRAAYPKSMLSIDNKYGALSFAQNPDDVPTPYGPNDPAPDYAVPDDVLPMSEPNFVPMSEEFAFAARPTNVPVPEARPEDIATPGLLTGYQQTEQAQTATPFDAVTPGQWGLNKNVAPALIPTVETWSDMAAAAPVQAPMDSVQATGVLGATPGLAANATVPSLPGAQPQAISQADVDRAFFNVTGSGQMDPAFTAGLMSPQNPVVPTAVESQSFTPGMQTAQAPADITQADVSRGLFNVTGAGQMDPSFTAGLMGPNNPVVPTSVQSVSYTQEQQPSAEVASAPADIGGFLDAMAAQRGPATGINSAEHQTQVANAMRQQFNPSIQAPAPVSEVATPGLLNNPAFAATNFNAAMNPSVPSLNVPTVTPTDQQTQAAAAMSAIPGIAAQAPQQAVAPVEQAIDNTITGSTTPGLFSPTSITASTPTLTGGGSLTSGLNKGLLSDQPINQVGFLSDLSPNVDINLSGNIVPAAAPQIAAPALETVSVAEQPTVAATVDGPATTPAIEQQQQQTTAPANTMADTTTSTTTTPTATTKSKGLLSGLMSPEALGGGLLGGLALGPAGGLLGALAGQQVARSGGLASMLSGQPATINNIGGGMMNTASIWGGGTEPGTQATTSNGGTVTQMPSGLVSVTGPAGVATGFDATGKGYAMWGGTPGSDGETTASSSNGGGFFGGMFGG